MGSLNPFKKPKISTPKVQPLPEGPSDEEVAKASQDELEQLRKQRGRASTILTSGQGVMGDDSAVSGLATRRLMGG